MRKIKILTKGPIRPMGMCHGPILTPWEVTDERLRVFLKAGLDVVEVDRYGKEHKLTLADVMTNGNNNTAESAPVEEPKNEKPVNEAPAVEPAEVKYDEPADEDVVDAEDVIEEPTEVVEDTVPETKPQYNNNHKKNKHKH